MSLDLSIADEEFNYTYNVSIMWREVFPHDKMVEIEGKTGEEALFKLRTAFNFMLTHYDEMVRYNPANGWGSFEGFMQWLTKLMLACKRHPQEVWKADR